MRHEPSDRATHRPGDRAATVRLDECSATWSCCLHIRSAAIAIADLWYKNAITYCLDVEKYQDANGDGVGDFEGLMRRLDSFCGRGGFQDPVTGSGVNDAAVKRHPTDGAGRPPSGLLHRAAAVR